MVNRCVGLTDTLNLPNSLIVRIWTELRTPYVCDASRPWQRPMIRANSSDTNSSIFVTRFWSSDSTVRSHRLLRPLRTRKTSNSQSLASRNCEPTGVVKASSRDREGLKEYRRRRGAVKLIYQWLLRGLCGSDRAKRFEKYKRMHRLGEYLEFVAPRQSLLKKSTRVVVPGD